MYPAYSAPYAGPPVFGPPVPLKKPVHPAAKILKLAILILALGLILALISLLVPWSRINDTGNGTTTTWIGLWDVCLTTDNYLDTFSCSNIDLDASDSVAGNNTKCRGFFQATQVLTVITFVMAFIGVILLVVLLMKLWTKLAMPICGVAIVWWLLTLGCAIAAWACWLVYGEEACAGTTSLGIPSWPIQGYSYGFICMCIASGLFLIGSLLLCVALPKLKQKKLAYYPPFPMAPPLYPAAPISPYVNYGPYVN